MRFLFLGAIFSRVTQSAPHLDIIMMVGVISCMMIVFMPALPRLPNMAAIYAWYAVWMRTTASAYFDIDTLASLYLISASRR